MRAAPTALFALVCSAAATGPAVAVSSVNVYGLRAPEEIAGFTLNDSTNYERIKPGDGYGLDYSQSGWKLDVFVYDLKRAAIPDDVKTAIVRSEFERSRADAFLAQPNGLYAQVYLRRNFTIEDAKRTRFQCATFYLTRDGAKPQDGYLCVTSWNNKFVRLRLTTLSDGTSTEAAARKYIGAWIPVLWGGGGTASVSRAEAPPEPPRARAARHTVPGIRPIHRTAPRRAPCPEGYICEYR